MFHYAGSFWFGTVTRCRPSVERGVRHFLMGFVVSMYLQRILGAVCVGETQQWTSSDPAYFVLAGRMSLFCWFPLFISMRLRKCFPNIPAQIFNAKNILSKHASLPCCTFRLGLSLCIDSCDYSQKLVSENINSGWSVNLLLRDSRHELFPSCFFTTFLRNDCLVPVAAFIFDIFSSWINHHQMQLTSEWDSWAVSGSIVLHEYHVHFSFDYSY